MQKIITANSVSAPQVVAPVPNQRFEAQIRGDKHLVIPADWGELVYGEVQTIAARPKAIDFRINPALKKRRLYAYFFINSSIAIFPDVQMFLAWDEQKLVKLSLYNANAAITTQSLPVFPVAGGNVVQNSIQLLIANQIAAEPASAILQAYEFEHAANRLIVDVNSMGGTIGTQTFYRIWVGCFSW